MRFPSLVAGSFGILLLALQAGCGASQQTVDDLNTRDVTLPNGRVISAELAVDREMMARGLMFRDHLAPDRGMLFIHEKPGHWQYWMYQCKIPLDIIWMDNQRRIVEISANTPPCKAKVSADCPTYGGHEEARYVLELAAGEAARNHLTTGQEISF